MMKVGIVLVHVHLLAMTSQADSREVRARSFELIGRDQTLAEMTYFGGTWTMMECAKFCVDNNCLTLVRSAGNRCGYSQMNARDGDPVIILPAVGSLMYNVYECDVSTVPCAQVEVAHSNYGKCNGIYDLVPGLWQFQRPVYFMKNTQGYPRYLRYISKFEYWTISGAIDKAVTAGFQQSHQTRTCHSMDESPWQNRNQTVRCL